MLREAFRRWYDDDNTFRIGAALAFYTVFSLAPVVLIAVAVGGMVFGQEAARARVAEEIAEFAGPQVGESFANMMQVIYERGSGALATVIGVVLLLVGASSVFAQLQDALNTIWGVTAREGRGVWGTIKDRFWSFAMVAAIGFVLLVSLIVSAVLAALGKWMVEAGLPGGPWLWQGIHFVVSLAVVTLFFALIYKVLPDVQLAWSDVWVGAAVTALLFTVGKYLIGLYLGHNSVASAYGAAGSLVVILLWVYYSSQILLLGAHFTYVYAQRSGRSVMPTPNAEPAKGTSPV